jgi:hypothetical protein
MDKVKEMLREHNVEIPMEMQDSDSLQPQSGIKIEDVYKIIGYLYFELQHRTRILNEQHTTIVGQLTGKIRELQDEVRRLQIADTQDR